MKELLFSQQTQLVSQLLFTGIPTGVRTRLLYISSISIITLCDNKRVRTPVGRPILISADTVRPTGICRVLGDIQEPKLTWLKKVPVCHPKRVGSCVAQNSSNACTEYCGQASSK